MRPFFLLAVCLFTVCWSSTCLKQEDLQAEPPNFIPDTGLKKRWQRPYPSLPNQTNVLWSIVQSENTLLLLQSHYDTIQFTGPTYSLSFLDKRDGQLLKMIPIGNALGSSASSAWSFEDEYLLFFNDSAYYFNGITGNILSKISLREYGILEGKVHKSEHGLYWFQSYQGNYLVAHWKPGTGAIEVNRFAPKIEYAYGFWKSPSGEQWLIGATDVNQHAANLIRWNPLSNQRQNIYTYQSLPGGWNGEAVVTGDYLCLNSEYQLKAIHLTDSLHSWEHKIVVGRSASYFLPENSNIKLYKNLIFLTTATGYDVVDINTKKIAYKKREDNLRSFERVPFLKNNRLLFANSWIFICYDTTNGARLWDIGTDYFFGIKTYYSNNPYDFKSDETSLYIAGVPGIVALE